MTASVREDLIQEALKRFEVLDSVRRKAFCARPPHWDVSLPQLYILTLIQERGPRTVSEIAALLSISVPSASSILDRMEEHGLVTRVRDEEDRRVVRVTITDAGRQAFTQVGGLHRDRIMRLLEVLSDDEVRDLITGIDALKAGLSRLGVENSPA